MPMFTAKGQPMVYNAGENASDSPRGQRATFLWNTQGKGVPRRDDLFTVRMLEKSHTVGLPMNTIKDQVSTCDWAIKPRVENPTTAHEEAADDLTEWLEGGFNQNAETFDHFLKQWLGDLLAMDAGVLELVPDNPNAETPYVEEMYVRDGATYTKNPDDYGRMPKPDSDEPAYYQFSLAGAMKPMGRNQSVRDLADEVGSLGYGLQSHSPVPFERDAIVWAEENPRSWSTYGWGRVQMVRRLAETVLNQDISNREYFDSNQIPEGVLSIVDANDQEIQRARKYWEDEVEGEEHKLPIMGSKTEYHPFRAAPSELNFLESQKWYNQLVWNCFGLSKSEVGQIDDVNRAAGKEANITVWRKTTKPLLELLMNLLNRQVLPFREEYHRVDGEIEFTFNFEHPTVEEKRKERQRQELQSGLVTVNEVRQDRGEEAVPWGDLPQDAIKAVARNEYTWLMEEVGIEDPPESDPLGGMDMFAHGSRAQGESESGTATSGAEGEEGAEGTYSSESDGDDEDFRQGVSDPLESALKDDPLRNEQYHGQFPPVAGHADSLQQKVAARFEDQLDDLEDVVEDNWVPEEARSGPNGDTKEFALDLSDITESITLSGTLTDVVSAENIAAMDTTAEWEAAQLEEQLEEHIDADEVEAAIDFDVEDSFAAEYMRNNAAKNMVSVEQTVRQRVQTTLQTVLEGEGGVDAATEALRDTFDSLTDSHSRLVARTETLGASRHGSQALAETSDVVGGKEWLASSDGRVREWHAEMDGVVVEENDTWTVPDTGHEDQPADYPRSARVVGEDQPFNCRCAQQAVLHEDMPEDPEQVAAYDDVTIKVGGEEVDGLRDRQLEVADRHAERGESLADLLDRTLDAHSFNKSAENLGISKNTLYNWCDEYEERLENYSGR